MHKKTRQARGIGKNARHHKVGVLGMLERKGKVRAKVIKSARMIDILPYVSEKIAQGSTLYTDESSAYELAYVDFSHDTVIHSALEYVRDNVYTNSIENFWSLSSELSKEPTFRYRPSIYRSMSRNSRSVTTTARLTIRVDLWSY